MLEWLLEHWELVGAVVAALIGAWKARKAGALNGFLVERIEGLASKEDKQAIQGSAIAAGLEGVLSKIVAKRTK